VNKRDNRWYCPAYWYDQVWHLEDSDTTVHMVFIDTVILSGDDNVTYPEQRKEQYAWINATLAASTADWLIVVGHYPVYSSGEHGNTADLQKNLKPMLAAYDVDMSDNVLHAQPAHEPLRHTNNSPCNPSLHPTVSCALMSQVPLWS